MKAILIVEMPKKCIDCPLVYKEDHFIYRCKVSEDQVDSNGIYCDCPLRPYQETIPVEWIEDWLEMCIPRYDYDRMTYIADVYEMLDDWEEENEKEERTNS